MTGDRSRGTFKEKLHLTSVRAQQGRVMLDADWNEQNDIVTHRLDWTFRDIIGRAAGPVDPDSFKVRIVGNAIKVSPGRYYVGGRLLENDAQVTLPAQPHLSGGYCVLNAPFAPAFDVPKPPAGEYAVMLDSWVRHVTVLEMPALLEPALHGVDTATRHQSVWQIKLMKIANGTSCSAVLDSPGWLHYAVPSPAKMEADTDTPPPAPDQCDLSPNGGYRGLDNNLYRVEIHDPGPAGTAAGTATVKWTVDNASVATLATGWDNSRTLTLASMPGDFTRGFKIGDTVELIDVKTELREQPGLMLVVDDLVGDTMTLSGPHLLGAATDGAAAAARQLRVRRWEGPISIPKNVNWLALGTDGVRVNFAKNVTYRTGDYWEIPARTAPNDIEWPGGAQPPANIAHLMTPLARVKVDAAGNFTLLGDCRTLFPPLSAMLSLHYVGGGGQQAEPNEAGNSAALPLAEPLAVAVMRGKVPVIGAPVQFTIKSGAGTLSPAIPVLTDSNGLASCTWSLDPALGPSSPPPKILDRPQEVEARMLDDVGTPFGNPVRFGARVLGLIEMKLAGGDTQTQAVPYGDADPVKLREPLCVAVTRANRPLPDATVRFTPIDGGAGSLSLAGGGAGTPHVEVLTDAEGMARCMWTVLPDKKIGHVRAHLRKNGVDFGAPDVVFSANLIQLPGRACCVTVGKGADYETLGAAIQTLLDKDVTDICICLTAGDHALSEEIWLAGREVRVNLSIHGCGPATRLDFGDHSIVAINSGAFEMADLHFKAAREVLIAVGLPSVTLRRLTGRSGGFALGAQDCAAVTVEDCDLEAFDPGNLAPRPATRPAPAEPAGGGRAGRVVARADSSLAGPKRFVDTSVITTTGLLFGVVEVARDLILLAGYDGQVRIVRNRLNGAINVGGQQPNVMPRLQYLSLWKAKRIQPVLRTGGTLTIADNMMHDLRVTGEPARVLGIEGPNPGATEPVDVPRLARLERNEIWAEGSVLAARYAFVDGNRFMAGGRDTEQLLVIVPDESDDDPTVKIVGNSGPNGSLIVTTGFPDELANRPLLVRF
jgi:hypothetical protein